jgi:hypothetical protein
MGKTKNAYMIIVGKTEGKIPLERPTRRWVHNIKTDLREIGWDGMDWIDLAQDTDQWRALVNMMMNLRGSLKCWEVPEWLHNWQLLRKGSAAQVSKYKLGLLGTINYTLHVRSKRFVTFFHSEVI